MIQITTTQIKTRLEKSFNDVKNLNPIELSVIEASPEVRTVTVLDLEGLTIVVGVYAENSSDESDYKRFAYMEQVKKTYLF